MPHLKNNVFLHKLRELIHKIKPKAIATIELPNPERSNFKTPNSFLFLMGLLYSD